MGSRGWYECWALCDAPKAQKTKVKAKVQSSWDGHGVSRTSLGPRIKGYQPFGSWDSGVLSLEGLTYIWTKIESKIMRLGQVMGIHGLEWVQSYIKLVRRVFGLGHIDPVYKDTLYSDSMKQMKLNHFLSNFLSLSFSLSSLLHILAAKNPKVSWPPISKRKERRC